MSNTVAAHTNGEDYQYTLFWHHACRLLYPESKVDKILIEASEPKGLDDIVIVNMNNDTLVKYKYEFYQVKFHMTSQGSITGNALIDPKYINASSVSFLQRLAKAQELYSSEDSTFHFFSTWPIHPEDPLAVLHENTDGHLRLHKLFDGTERSKMANLKQLWIEHLNLQSEEELKKIIFPLRIHIGPSLKYLRDGLNDRLYRVGLNPVPEGQMHNPYEDLTRKLIEAGETELDKHKLKRICEEEGLFQTVNKTKYSKNESIAIRSFIQWAENLPDQVDVMLCLSEYFDGRNIVKGSWNEISNRIDVFLKNKIIRGNKYDLHLPIHTSLAFYIGRCLPEKIGAKFSIYQNFNGYELWGKTEDFKIDEPWLISETSIKSDGTDLVVAISVTHDILKDVEMFLSKNKIKVNTVIHLTFLDIAKRPINNGNISFYYAKKVIEYLQNKSKSILGIERFHIFISAPNVFSFHLGQVSIPLNNISLYEFDFESESTGAYSNSINL